MVNTGANDLNRVSIKDDLDLKKIADSGQCFRIKPSDEGAFRFVHMGHVLDMKHISKDEFEISCSEEEFTDVWHEYFDLDRDYRKIRKSIDRNDDYLMRSAEYGKGIRILKQEPWETLISFIISQRKNIPAITAAVDAMCRGYGKKIGKSSEYSFPDARALSKLSDEEWKALKLGYREKYIRQAVLEAPDMTAFYGLSDEALMERLMGMYGVGIKVASCTALFAYGRVDLAPVDVWINRIFENEYGGENVLAGRKNAGILQQYLFFYVRGMQGS